MVLVYYKFSLRLKKSKEIEGNIYDAFICFSKDICKIMKAILNVLEQTPPYHKVCVAPRDWRAGVIFSDVVIVCDAQLKSDLHSERKFLEDSLVSALYYWA